MAACAPALRVRTVAGRGHRLLVVVPEVAPGEAVFGSNVAACNVPALRRALEEALEQYELERHAVETFARMPTEGNA